MIHIDGIIFSLQERGGISTYFRELLAHLERFQVPHALTLEEPVRGAWDAGAWHREGRILERYRRCRELEEPSAQAVFHSSYYRLAASSRTPTVVTVHDFVYERYYGGPRLWVHSAQKRAAIRQAQAIICISEATRQDLMDFVGVRPGQEVHVIHNAASSLFHPVQRDAHTAPFVLFVGQRGGYKNFALLVEAMQHLPSIELKCVGGGAFSVDELATMPLGIKNRITHAGAVDDIALNRLYNNALCLAYPSAYEGFGIPVIEAMQAGCPVTCIPCAAVLEVGGDALSVAAEADPRALATAIENTAGAGRTHHVSKGLEVARRYSWTRTHEQTCAVYRILAG